MNNTLLKQKQIMQTKDLQRSFVATTNLHKALTKERITPQHDLLKISDGKLFIQRILTCVGKDLLNELKALKKSKEPKLSEAERLAKDNKTFMKG